MEFTEANSGERASMCPLDNTLLASHQGQGVWHLHKLPDLSRPVCVLHSGSSHARLEWSMFSSDWLLFYTADTVLLFCLAERLCRDTDNSGGGGERTATTGSTKGPGQPDGVVKEARHVAIERAFFLTAESVAVVLAHGLGVRVWNMRQQHVPALECSGLFRSGPGFMAALHHKSLVVLEADSLRVADKWTVPDGAIIKGFVFLGNRRHYDHSRYCILAWQCEQQFVMWAVEEGRGFVKIAAEEAIFAVDAARAIVQNDIAVFTDRNGSLTLFNLLTRALISKVAINLSGIKQRGVVVFREVIRQSESWFDAGYEELLGSAALVGIDGDACELTVKWSGCGRFLAVCSSQYPTLLFIYNLKGQTFPAVLFLQHPITSFSWHPQEPFVTCCCASSSHLYSWQPEGARCIPYPHGPVSEGIEWIDDGALCLVRGNRSFALAVPALE